jgi:hypothetical protein
MVVSLPETTPASPPGTNSAVLDTSVDPPVLVTPANPVPQAGHDPADSAWDVWALDEAGELGGSGNDDRAEPTHRTLPAPESPVPAAPVGYQAQPAHEPRPDYATRSDYEPVPVREMLPPFEPQAPVEAAPEPKPPVQAAPVRDLLPPFEPQPRPEPQPAFESQPAFENEPAFENQPAPEPVPTMLGLKRPAGGDEEDRPAAAIPGFLRFSTGQVVPLDRSVIVGRAPAVNQNPDGPRSVKIDNEDQDISRNHLEVRLEGGQVTAVDLNSANGTIVTIPGRMPQQLAPHQPFPLVFGAVVELSEEVSFRYEVKS